MARVALPLVEANSTQKNSRARDNCAGIKPERRRIAAQREYGGKVMPMTQEEIRLEQTRQKKAHWQRWGPYLSERAWRTVREDYSSYGTA
jgi:hypothetical protein